MRLKIWTLLFAVLLAAPAFAQVGGVPGITAPVNVSNLDSPTITGTVDATGAVLAGQDALCFDGTTAGTFKTCFRVTDPTSNRFYTIPNSGNAVTPLLVGAGANPFANATSFSYDDGLGVVNSLSIGGAGQLVASTTSGAESGTLAASYDSAEMYYTNGAVSSQFRADASSALLSAAGATSENARLYVFPTEVVVMPDVDNNGTGSFAVGDDFFDDQIRIDPAGGGAGNFDVTITTTDITAAQTVTLPNASGNFTLNGQFDHAVVDSGGAGAATYSLVVDPGDSVATLDCLDADGCEVTLSETNAVPGQRLVILCTAATAGATTLKHSAGVVNLYNSADRALPIGDAIEVVYIASTWSQIGNYDSAP